MFERILMGQSESDIFWIATPNAGCTCDIGKMAIDDTKTNIHFTGRVSSSAAGFMTKLSSLGIQQGTKNFGGSGQFYVGRACDMRGSQTCHATGWNDNLIAPIYGVNFATNQTYRNHFWRGTGGTIGLGVYAASGAGIYSGTVYICGQWIDIVEGEPTGFSCPWVARLNDAGMGWSIVYQTEWSSAFYDVALMPNGNLVAVGSVWAGGAKGEIVIINPTTGVILNRKHLDNIDFLTSVAVNPDNTFIVGGLSEGRGYVSKVSADLSSVIWQNHYTSSQVNNVAIDSGGNVFAIASLSGNALIYKYSPTGTLLWQRSFGTAAGDAGYGLVVGANDCIYIKTQCGSNVVVAKLPGDGSLTGTYGIYTYAVGTATQVLRTRGVSNSTSDDIGNMGDYPYTAGNWNNGTITWTGAIIP
jgi:WD40 repeat protein